MTNEELKNHLSLQNPSLVTEDSQEWLVVNAEVDVFPTLVQTLKTDPTLHFDYLFCLTCVDWKTHLSMVYHFRSLNHTHSLVLKVKLDRTKPEIKTVSNLWRTAEFHEREVYDLFGVIFTHHPDLRRIFLTEEWVGWPLRKDYDDPVNMIKL